MKKPKPKLPPVPKFGEKRINIREDWFEAEEAAEKNQLICKSILRPL